MVCRGIFHVSKRNRKRIYCSPRCNQILQNEKRKEISRRVTIQLKKDRLGGRLKRLPILILRETAPVRDGAQILFQAMIGLGFNEVK
jgi:hypothetical protein